MSQLSLLSIAPGATIQDRGRPGLLRYGVTQGGALDPYGLAEGQALLQNRAEDAALELPGFGGRFRAKGVVQVATSGGAMALSVNGQPMVWRQSIWMADGDVMEIGAAEDGVVGYLHIAGGFQTRRDLGARSTHLRAGFGHRPARGDTLGAGRGGQGTAMSLPRPAYLDQRRLRVIWGPQSHLFTEATRSAFLAARFSATGKRDRMGLVLAQEGPALRLEAGLSIASDVTLLGDIQLTGDAVPTVLLADRGSSGGYPRIATVVAADLKVVAQLPIGAEIGVDLITPEEALDLARAEAREIGTLAAQCRPVLRDPRDIGDLLAYNLVDGVVRGDETDAD